MSDIFISYAREDAETAERLARGLESAGYSCWWDRNLVSGSRYLAETEAELLAAKAVLVIWSPLSIKSHWVADEASVGRDRGKLAAVSFDGAMPPLGFRQFQVTDLSSWQGGMEEPAFLNLLSGLKRLATPQPEAVGAIARPAKGNLPCRLSALIGRAAELAEIGSLLQTTRLVTLTGPGGIGKTRMAIEAARAAQEAYADGAWMVELAGLNDPADLPGAILRTLGIESDDNRASSLLGRLPLWRTLIVLDNCEHVIEAAAELVEEMLHRAPDLRILVTSQEILGIEGERVVRLRALGDSDGTELFLRCARSADPDFTPDQADAAAVQAICERLDGIPLAIEMAAARAPVLGCREMLRLLDDRFRVLTAGRRTALPRQRTLQATLDWSHSLLDPGDAKVFRRLSVFAGSCSLEAAGAVAGDEQTPSIAVADAIGRLADKSLILVDRSLGPARFRLLETMRAYAQQKLFDAGETRALQQRHAAYYCAFFASSPSAFWGDASDATLLSRYGGELDNVTRALEWAFGPDGEPHTGARLAADAGTMLAFYGLFLDLANWSAIGLRALEETGPSDIRDRLKAGALIAALFAANNADIVAVLQQAQALLESRDWAARIGAHVVCAWASGALARHEALKQATEGLARQGLPAISRAACYAEFAQVLASRASGDSKADHPALCQSAVVKARAIGADQVVNNIIAWGTTADMPWDDPDAVVDPARALLERLLAHTGYRLVRVNVAQLAGRFITALVQRGRPDDLAEAREMAHTIEQRRVRVVIHLYRVSLAWLAWGDKRPADAARLLGLLDESGLTEGLLASDKRALMERLADELNADDLDLAQREGSSLTWEEAFRIAVGSSQAPEAAGSC